VPVYVPGQLFWWWYWYDAYAPSVFIRGGIFAASGGLAAVVIAVALSVQRARELRDATTFGSARWARPVEVTRAGLLRDAGIRIDTSVRSLFDYSVGGGPDYSHHPLAPYWVDRDHQLLELPVTTTYSGALRRIGPLLHRVQRHVPTMFSGFSRFGLLERIALTPEGVTVAEAIRGIDIAVDSGLPMLVLSFHSPTLAPGHTPYAKDEAAVDALYDWFAAIYAALDQRGVRTTTVSEIIVASRG